MEEKSRSGSWARRKFVIPLRCLVDLCILKLERSPGMKRLLILIMLAAPAFAQQQTGPRTEERYIVTFVPGASQAQKLASVQRAGGKLRFNYSIVNAAAVELPGPNAINALANDRSIASILPDRPIHAIEGPGAIKENGKGSPSGGGGT